MAGYPPILGLGNGGIPSPAAIAAANRGSVVATGNSTPTNIITASTWQTINLNGLAVLGSNNTNWTLDDATTGGLRYAGEEDFNGSGLVCLTAEGQPGTNNFFFRLTVNGLATTDNVQAGVTTSNNQYASLTLLTPLQAVNGDLVRLEVFNNSGTQDLTIVNLSMLLT